MAIFNSFLYVYQRVIQMALSTSVPREVGQGMSAGLRQMPSCRIAASGVRSKRSRGAARFWEEPIGAKAPDKLGWLWWCLCLVLLLNVIDNVCQCYCYCYRCGFCYWLSLLLIFTLMMSIIIMVVVVVVAAPAAAAVIDTTVLLSYHN